MKRSEERKSEKNMIGSKNGEGKRDRKRERKRAEKKRNEGIEASVAR